MKDHRWLKYVAVVFCAAETWQKWFIFEWLHSCLAHSRGTKRALRWEVAVPVLRVLFQHKTLPSRLLLLSPRNVLWVYVKSGIICFGTQHGSQQAGFPTYFPSYRSCSMSRFPDDLQIVPNILYVLCKESGLCSKEIKRCLFFTLASQNDVRAVIIIPWKGDILASGYHTVRISYWPMPVLTISFGSKQAYNRKWIHVPHTLVKSSL